MIRAFWWASACLAMLYSTVAAWTDNYAAAAYNLLLAYVAWDVLLDRGRTPHQDGDE